MSKGKGVYKWAAIDRICNSVMTFGGNILLARLLDPSDFGLLGMVAIFSALAYNISGCGMSDGLINKKDATADDYSTVFVFNAAMGLMFATLFIACSGLIAAFFGHKELKGIMIAIGVCFFFQSLVLVQETRMRKDLDFKKMAIVRLSSTASSLILAVILVLTGFGYWGLVSMQIFLSFFLFVYYVAVSRWIPKIWFNVKSFKEMFGYGVHLMVAYICFQIARNVNMSVLGKYSTASASGAYNQGHKLQEVPFALSESILNWPFFAVLATTPQEERRQLTGRMHSVIVFANAVIGCYLLAVSTYAFHALYGQKWDIAIPIFNVLVIFGFATRVKMFYQTVFKAHARTRVIRDLTITEVVLQLAMLAVCYRMSTTVIAYTQTVPALAILMVYIPLYLRSEGINLKVFASEVFMPILLPLAVLAATTAISNFWAIEINSFVALIAVTAIFGAMMFLLCQWLRPAFYLDLLSRLKKK